MFQYFTKNTLTLLDFCLENGKLFVDFSYYVKKNCKKASDIEQIFEKTHSPILVFNYGLNTLTVPFSLKFSDYTLLFST